MASGVQLASKRRGDAFSAIFWKFRKSAQIFQKNVFSEYLGEQKSQLFPSEPFSSESLMNCLSKNYFSERPLPPWKISGFALEIILSDRFKFWNNDINHKSILSILLNYKEIWRVEHFRNVPFFQRISRMRISDNLSYSDW